MMQIHRKRHAAMLLVALLSLAGLAPAALASEAYHAIGFVVHAVLPENQIDGAGYYNLLMTPGQSQTIEVEVVNKLGEEIYVSVTLGNASSNPSGLIAYQPTEVRDESLALGLTDVAEIRLDQLSYGPEEAIRDIEGNVLTLAPGAAVRIPIEIVMPEEPLDGQLLGGVTVTRIRPREEAQQSALEIHSVYSYAVAIQLQSEKEPAIAPDFALLSAEITDVAGWGALTLSLRNPVPLVVAGGQMTVQVLAEGTEDPVQTHTVDRFAMAPNSTMPYTIVFPPGGALPAGRYTVDVALTYAGNAWHMQTPLVIP